MGALRSSIGEGAWLVGDHVVALDPLVLQGIGRKDALGAGGDRRGPGERAGLVDQDRVGGNQRAVSVRAHLDLDVRPGGGTGGFKGLGAGHLHLDGPSGLFRQQGCHGFQVERNLAAKPTADLHWYDFDLGDGQIEHASHCIAGNERALGAGPHRQVSIRIPERRGVLWLDITLVHGAGVELAFDDEVRSSERGFHVSLLVHEPVGDIAVLVGFLTELRRCHVFVEQIGVVLHRIQHVGAGLQDLVVNLDQTGRLLGDVG